MFAKQTLCWNYNSFGTVAMFWVIERVGAIWS